MNVNRRTLARHLSRIACNGQIEGAVFRDGFRTAALSPDQLLLVLAPELDGAEALTDEVGVPSLGQFSSALFSLDYEGEGPERPETVELDVRGHHLTLEEPDGRQLRLLIAAPKTIGTYVSMDIVGKLENTIPSEGEALQLSRRLVADVQSTFSLFKAGQLELIAGPDGGKIRVGQEDYNVAEFPDPSLVAEEEHTLLFGRHLVDVLSVVSDPAAAVLRLGGPDKPILIEDEGFRYVLSPKARGADA